MTSSRRHCEDLGYHGDIADIQGAGAWRTVGAGPTPQQNNCIASSDAIISASRMTESSSSICKGYKLHFLGSSKAVSEHCKS